MKNTFKKIVAYVVTFAIFSVIVSGMTVSASQSFSYNIGSGNPNSYITLKKYNNTNYATVNITSVNLSNTSVVIWIADSSGNKITPTKAVNEMLPFC